MHRLKKNKILITVIIILLTGFLIPQRFVIPVEGAKKGDWNEESFWYYPWGESVTHKGVDIFAKEGTNVVSSTSGFIVYKGEIGRGGLVVLILGPKWRLHYYAHLNEINIGWLNYAGKGEKIGTVGRTGNAKNTPPHLHYTILTIVPYPWRIDSDIQGWKKMFYLNPIEYMNKSLSEIE